MSKLLVRSSYRKRVPRDEEPLDLVVNVMVKASNLTDFQLAVLEEVAQKAAFRAASDALRGFASAAGQQMPRPDRPGLTPVQGSR